MIPVLTPTPVVDPAALPDDRAGTTWRYRVNDDRSLTLCARLEHDAAPASKEAA